MDNQPRSATEIVRNVIEKDAVVRNGLARGLINVRALARYIQTITREDTTFEALIAAIRRYPIKETAAKRVGVGRLITNLSMKNRIVDVIIRNEPGIPGALAKFSEQIDYGRGETLSIGSGSQTVTVVLDSKNLDKLTKLIPKEKVLNIIKDLAMVTVTLAPEHVTTPGVVATMTADFAMEGVNLFDAIHTVPDIIFTVRERDALRIYQAMEKLSKED